MEVFASLNVYFHPACDLKKTWTKRRLYLFLNLVCRNSHGLFLKKKEPDQWVSEKADVPQLGCYSFTWRSLRSFEKSSWNCLREGREWRLSVALRMCHRRQMAPWEKRVKTHTWALTFFCRSHALLLSNKPPGQTSTWFNSCRHLLRILSALSISSSRVVFTDRLCGDRSLSAAWPVIFRSAGVSKHSHYSLLCSHLFYATGSVEHVFSWLFLQWHCGSRGKCL